MLYPAELRAPARGSITRLGRTGPAACCGAAQGVGLALVAAFRKKTSSSPSDTPRHVNARFHQVTKEFPHQEDVGFLELVIVAEFELIGLGHDQSLVGLAENAFFLQSIGPSPDGFDGQGQKPRQRGPGNALLDLVWLDGMQTAKPAIQPC